MQIHSKTNPNIQSLSMPYVIEQTAHGERSYDIFSRLLKDRIIMLTGEITDATASVICAQLLFLASEDDKKDISIYINSPGGSVSAGMAIHDTMMFIKPDVSTVCMGVAASMGAFLLASGAKGKRICLPNAEVMIHQPLGGTQGQASDMLIAAEHIKRTKERMTTMLADYAGTSYEDMEKAMDRDNWLTADDAKNFGLIDKIITHM